jgi:hypothetical protein
MEENQPIKSTYVSNLSDTIVEIPVMHETKPIDPVPLESQCFYCEKKTLYKSLTCADHRYCSHCSCALSDSDVKVCVDNKTSIPECPACGLEFAYRMKMLSDKSKVEIPRIYFEYLNRMRLFIEPDEDASLETNEKEAERRTIPLVQNMNHEQKLFLLRRLQAGCASVSLMISRDRKNIERVIKERDNERFADALAERTKPRVVKKQPKAIIAETETKQEKALRQAIAGMVALGMNESEAKTALGIKE